MYTTAAAPYEVNESVAFVPNLKYVGACVLGELALRSASLFRVGPGYAGAGFGDQRYAEVYYVFHDVADHGG